MSVIITYEALRRRARLARILVDRDRRARMNKLPDLPGMTKRKRRGAALYGRYSRRLALKECIVRRRPVVARRDKRTGFVPVRVAAAKPEKRLYRRHTEKQIFRKWINQQLI